MLIVIRTKKAAGWYRHEKDRKHGNNPTTGTFSRERSMCRVDAIFGRSLHEITDPGHSIKVSQIEIKATESTAMPLTSISEIFSGQPCTVMSSVW